MSEELKVESLPRAYFGEIVPKSAYDDLLTKYERSLVHLGQLKEQNRYMLEFKNIKKSLRKDLEEKKKILAEKNQNIAELEMYIQILEEKRKKDKKHPRFLQSLNPEEIEALDKIFNA